MAFCPSCGKPIGEGQRFCGRCGEPAPEKPAATTAEEPEDEAAAEESAEEAYGEAVGEAADTSAAGETVALPDCVACGDPLEEGADFCGACGVSQVAAAAGATAATATVTQVLTPPAPVATTQLLAAPIQPPLQTPFVPGFEVQPGYGQSPVPPPPGYGQAAPARKINPNLISLAIILVTVAAAVLAFYLTSPSDGDAAMTGVVILPEACSKVPTLARKIARQYGPTHTWAAQGI